MTAYQDLEATFRRVRRLEEIAGVLYWDMRTMMPAGGADGRAAQLSELTLLSHEMMTSPELAAKLDDATAEVSDDDVLSASLREMKRTHLHANAGDAKLVEEMTKVGIECTMLWR